MAYSVFGYVYDSSCNPVAGVQIIPYFKKVDSGSDDSKLSTIYYTTDVNGYYGFSLEDANLLGSAGAYKKGVDKIYTCAVLGGSGTKDSLDITDAVFNEHTIDAGSDLQVDMQLLVKRSPIIDSSSIPDMIATQHAYTMSETSYTDTSWETNACGMAGSQKLVYDLVPMMDGHQLVDTVYTWGETAPRLASNNGSSTYTFQSAGYYNIGITVREKWGTQTQVGKVIRVLYNEPVMDFSWTPTSTTNWDGAKIKGQEEVSFHNDTTCLDNRLNSPYTYKWEIEDRYQNGADNSSSINAYYSTIPTKRFQSAGSKTVKLTCYWNDGFSNRIASVTKEVVIYPYTIIPEFSWDAEPSNRGQDVTFSPATTAGDTSLISGYSWTITDSYPAPSVGLYTFSSSDTSVFAEGSSDNTTEVDNTYVITNTEFPSVKFHSMGAKLVTLSISYYDGWKTISTNISHTVTPTKYSITCDFSIDNTTPQGRDVAVTHTNTSSVYTQDGVDLGYSIDWYADDTYDTCNLDNPVPGVITDNSVTIEGVAKDTTMVHNYQNTTTHTAKLVIRYDDGWQMQTKIMEHTVTPIVYDGIVAEFSWGTTPRDRATVVTFNNDTVDTANRYRSVSWEISDHYNVYNPDNSAYGVNTVDNTQVITHDTTVALQPTHKFQDSTDENVQMWYWYDDGYCERVEYVSHVITKSVWSITPAITTDKETVGITEVTYTNSSTGATTRMLDEKWEWNDRVFPTNTDAITIRDDQVVNAEQKFTWQTPSRAPYSSISGATANINKEVSLEVRLDTGWRDDTVDGTVGSDNTGGDGGQVYWPVSTMLEANTYEVSSSITHTDNKLGYTH